MMSELPDVIKNGDPEHTYAGCVNLSFAYVEGIMWVCLPTSVTDPMIQPLLLNSYFR